jgi:hypothetical protein
MSRTHVLFGLCVIGGILLPSIAFAQFVPVRDETLITAFQAFSNSFNEFRTNDFANFQSTFNDTFHTTGGRGTTNSITTGTSDSIRDLIAGSNPGGIAAEPCVVGYASDDIFRPSRLNDTTQPAVKYWHSVSANPNPKISPWRKAVEASMRQGDILPDTIPSPDSPSRTEWGATDGPVVNTSRSLRCLLQELVEWKKLDLSIQIHMLLKQYISDAQTRMLANQFENQLAAANLAAAREGYVTTESGIEVRSPILVTNYNDYLYGRTKNEVLDLEARILANESDPIGSLGYPERYKKMLASQVARQTTDLTYKPLEEQPIRSYSGITDPVTGILPNDAALDEWYRDPNTPLGPGSFLSMNYMLQNPQATGIGALTQVIDFAAQRALTEAENFKRRVMQGEGVLDTTRNVVTDPAINPFGISDYEMSVTPAEQNRMVITAPYRNTLAQLARTDSADQAPTGASQSAGYRSNIDGAITFDTFNLATTTNAAHDIVKELYDTMWFGYFDLHPYTAEWAQATMLAIYDTLKFNDQVPSVVVSDAGTAPGTGTGDPFETPPMYPTDPSEIFFP